MMKLCEQFIDPSTYGPYRLPAVPGTILRLLTGDRIGTGLPDDALGEQDRHYDKVVLMLLDGFGWAEFQRAFARNSFLKERVREGRLLKLATQFPSTTACNVTTINTGLNVARHGVYEWIYYEPEVDDIIAPLLYSYAREQKERDTLKKQPGLQPADIYPSGNIYKALDARGVKSYVFQNKEYAHSPYSDTLFAPAQVNGYSSLKDGLLRLARRVINERGPAYYYFYYEDVDSALHHNGPGSEQVKNSVDKVLAGLEDIFMKRTMGKASNTAVMLVADHGQTTIDYRKTIYLNREIPELEKCIKRNREGRLLVPAGSCRDMFLYIEEPHLNDALELLQDRLKGKAIVCKTSLLVDNGYFMETSISEILAGRLGNLVILPLDGESVWWYEKDMFEINYSGHHGGLTPEEMEIPFLTWQL